MELGQCFCIIQGNEAVNAEVCYVFLSCDCHVMDMLQEVEERFYLVFPDRFIILAVGASLSGYELKVSSVCLSTIDHFHFVV